MIWFKNSPSLHWLQCRDFVSISVRCLYTSHHVRAPRRTPAPPLSASPPLRGSQPPRLRLCFRSRTVTVKILSVFRIVCSSGAPTDLVQHQCLENKIGDSVIRFPWSFFLSFFPRYLHVKPCRVGCRRPHPTLYTSESIIITVTE